MIFSKKRNLRLVTVRRGGTLRDPDHHLLAFWAADCAQHVLHFFEHVRPGDDRPRRAIELARAWARGEITMRRAPQSGRTPTLRFRAVLSESGPRQVEVTRP